MGVVGGVVLWLLLLGGCDGVGDGVGEVDGGVGDDGVCGGVGVSGGIVGGVGDDGVVWGGGVAVGDGGGDAGGAGGAGVFDVGVGVGVGGGGGGSGPVAVDDFVPSGFSYVFRVESEPTNHIHYAESGLISPVST